MKKHGEEVSMVAVVAKDLRVGDLVIVGPAETETVVGVALTFHCWTVHLTTAKGGTFDLPADLELEVLRTGESQ